MRAGVRESLQQLIPEFSEYEEERREVAEDRRLITEVASRYADAVLRALRSSRGDIAKLSVASAEVEHQVRSRFAITPRRARYISAILGNIAALDREQGLMAAVAAEQTFHRFGPRSDALMIRSLKKAQAEHFQNSTLMIMQNRSFFAEQAEMLDRDVWSPTAEVSRAVFSTERVADSIKNGITNQVTAARFLELLPLDPALQAAGAERREAVAVGSNLDFNAGVDFITIVECSPDVNVLLTVQVKPSRGDEVEIEAYAGKQPAGAVPEELENARRWVSRHYTELTSLRFSPGQVVVRIPSSAREEGAVDAVTGLPFMKWNRTTRTFRVPLLDRLSPRCLDSLTRCEASFIPETAKRAGQEGS